MILDTITRNIQIQLEGAITTDELDWVVSYVDHTDETFVPAADTGVSSGATLVTIIAAPVASTQRQIKYINVTNRDTVAHTLTVWYYDNTNLRGLFLANNLNPGYSVIYTDTTGWTVVDADGKVLILQALSDEAIPKSIVDTKGDLIAASADDTVVRLVAPSKKFSTLYYDSAQGGGLAWGLRSNVQLEPFSMARQTDCVSGDGKAWLHIPAHLDGLDLVEVHGETAIAGSGSTMAVQIRNVTQAVDMLTVKLTWDSGETGTDEAATPYDINESNDDVSENDMIAIDFDQLHTTPAKGCIISLGFA